MTQLTRSRTVFRSMPTGTGSSFAPRPRNAKSPYSRCVSSLPGRRGASSPDPIRSSTQIGAMIGRLHPRLLFPAQSPAPARRAQSQAAVPADVLDRHRARGDDRRLVLDVLVATVLALFSH